MLGLRCFALRPRAGPLIRHDKQCLRFESAKLTGDGGAGKSLLAAQLAVAAATDGQWLGFDVYPCDVLFLSAEDEMDELHRRLAKLAPRLDMLHRLTIAPFAGKDAVLAAPIGRDGLIHPTPLFRSLKQLIVTQRPGLLVLDTLADLFGGDEIKKVQARQFISLLRGLALEYKVTVLLLYHPSQSGMASGEGTSGNVAWNNSVRSRLYFERRIFRGDGRNIEDERDIRILSLKKSNRAEIGSEIVVRYRNGAFVREAQEDIDTRDTQLRAEALFLKLLAEFEEAGRSVSPNPSNCYAPKIFAAHPDAKGITKGTLQKAMDRLFSIGRIRVGMTDGPPSKRRQKIEIVASCEAADNADDASPDMDNQPEADNSNG